MNIFTKLGRWMIPGGRGFGDDAPRGTPKQQALADEWQDLVDGGISPDLATTRIREKYGLSP